MLAVIRIRGDIGVKKEVKDTLKMLNLHRKNTCVIIPETPYFLGMIRKAKDYITWGEISEDVLKKMVEKRGRLEGDKKIDDAFLKKNKIKNMDEIIKKITEGKIKEIGIKPYFRLSPPSKGYKGSVKQHYPKGVLGYRKDKINELLKRMI